MTDDGLRDLLLTLDPKARETLRHVLVRDQADRDAIASNLLRYRDQTGDDWADIIDVLTMHLEARRKVVRLLAEIEASPRESRPFQQPKEMETSRLLRSAGDGMSPSSSYFDPTIEQR